MCARGGWADLRFEVLLDTNALRGAGWIEVTSTETKRLAREVPNGVELRIVTPQISRDERCYQMTKSALDAADAARSLAKIVGGDVVDDRTAIQRVSEHVDRELRELGIRVVEFDYQAVTLERIVDDAVQRVAPFEPGSEKGFKDRIVLETALQVVRANQGTDTETLLVTGDARLHTALVARISGIQNVIVLRSVPDAITQVKAAAAKLENVDALRSEAAALFLQLLRSELANRVSREFAEKLSPEGDTVRRDLTFQPSDPALIGVGVRSRSFATELTLRSRVTRLFDERTNDYEQEVYELSGIATGPIVHYEVWEDRFEVRWAAHDDEGHLADARVENVEYLGRLVRPSR